MVAMLFCIDGHVCVEIRDSSAISLEIIQSNYVRSNLLVITTIIVALGISIKFAPDQVIIIWCKIII